jgi:lipopolysaccharide transport system permease protein
MDLTTSESARAAAASKGAQAAATAESPHAPQTPSLPDKPLVTIEPSSKWVALDLRSVWDYRELLYFLTWRDVKVRYKQTALGVAWAVIQPVMTMLIFTIFFGKFAGVENRIDVPYPLFAFAGLLPWTFFSNAVTNSGNSIVGSAHLITKVYFPRLMVPAAAVGAGLVDLGIAFVILLGLMLYYGVALTWAIAMLPVLVVLITLLALGMGMWLSALNVKYRDVRYAIPFLVQIWMFLSPIIYPPTMIPEKWRWLLALNPLTGIIEGFRSALFGRAFDWRALFISAAITLLLLVYSAYAFRRMEKSFADVV